MGKTILELFQTQPLNQGPFVGQTAEVAYEVRDFKKENPISGPSPLLNATGFAAANVARRNLSSRLTETLLEGEVTGVRIIRAASEAVIYGTEIGRITQRTTNVLDAMKSASNNGELPDAGLVGNALNRLETAATNFASKLGIEFPQKLIPTRIATNGKFTSREEPDTMRVLAEIKKDGAGNLVGKFLAQNVKGTPQQIKNAVLGNVIEGAKGAVRKKLFGSRTEAGQNLATKSDNEVQYSSKTPYSKTVDVYNDDIIGRNDLSSTAKAVELLDAAGVVENQNEVVTAKYSTGELSGLSKNSDDVFERRDLSTQLAMQRGLYEARIDAGVPEINIPTFPNRNNRNKYFYTDDKQQRYAYKGISNFTDDNIRDIVLTGEKRGINNKTDAINKYDNGVTDSTEKIDFVTLKFDSTQFRATITGLNENYTPSWDSNKFIGSPFNYYTYTGIERNVTFNFKVFSLNIEEHNKAWNKLQALAKKTYPKGYTDYGVVAPIIQFTMTDLYKSKYSFIESLSFTIDDNYPWEVYLEGMRLPHIIDVAITLKFIEQRGDEGKLYGFENVNLQMVKRPAKTAAEKAQDKANLSNADIESANRQSINSFESIELEEVNTDDGEDFVPLKASTTVIAPKPGNIPTANIPAGNVQRTPQLPPLVEEDTEGGNVIKDRNKISRANERKASFGSGEELDNQSTPIANRENRRESREMARQRKNRGQFNQTVTENRNTAWYLLRGNTKGAKDSTIDTLFPNNKILATGERKLF
jgi:hypothetical protein